MKCFHLNKWIISLLIFKCTKVDRKLLRQSCLKFKRKTKGFFKLKKARRMPVIKSDINISVSPKDKVQAQLDFSGGGDLMPPPPPPLVKTHQVKQSKSHQSVLNHSKKRKTGSKSVDNKSSKSSASSTEERLKEIEGHILDSYQIIRRVGKGAYGIVWEAEEKKSKERVALKKIFDGFRNSTDAQRTYREVMFLREFGHHPMMINLLSVHKSKTGLDLYLVFPFIDTDLHKVIKMKPKELTDEVVRKITYQVLIAINYLHSAEVIHRDLKPANILITDSFQIKLADFGLARSIAYFSAEDFTTCQDEYDPVMTDYVATRWYRPPEILLNSKTYTKGVDMWSVGCILAEILLRKPLFPGGNTNEQIEMIMQTIKEPLEEEILEMCRGTKCRANVGIIQSSMELRGDPLYLIFEPFDFPTVDIIERLLVFSPEQRLTVEEAIMHPYCASVRQPHKEWASPYPIRPPLNDNVKLTLEDYRDVIYDMIDNNEFCGEEHLPIFTGELNRFSQPLVGLPENIYHPQPGSQGEEYGEKSSNSVEVQSDQDYEITFNHDQDIHFNELQNPSRQSSSKSFDLSPPSVKENPLYFNTNKTLEDDASNQEKQNDPNNNYETWLKFAQNEYGFNDEIVKSKSDFSAALERAVTAVTSVTGTPPIEIEAKVNIASAAISTETTYISPDFFTASKGDASSFILPPPPGVSTFPSSITTSIIRPSSNQTQTNSIVGERTIKNLSILTLPSERLQPVPPPPKLNLSSQKLLHNNKDNDHIYSNKSSVRSMNLTMKKSSNPPEERGDHASSVESGSSDSSSVSEEEEEEEEEEKDDNGPSSIVQNFRNLCQKYDVDLSLEDGIGDCSKDYPKKSKKQKEKEEELTKVSRLPATNNFQMVQIPFEMHAKFPTLEKNNLLGSRSGPNLSIIPTTQPTSSSKNVLYNPYKPKGLKTSMENSSSDINLMRDFRFSSSSNIDATNTSGISDLVRNSRSLPSQIGGNVVAGGKTSMNMGIGLDEVMSSFLKTSDDLQEIEQKNQGQERSGHGNSSNSEYSKGYNKYIQENEERLLQLFPTKEAAQARLDELESRSKRGSTIASNTASRENSLQSSLLINGKYNASRGIGQVQEKKKQALARNKFTFNRPGKKPETTEVQARPYGGRIYDKKFTGPSFLRKAGTSFSDSETHLNRSWRIIGSQNQRFSPGEVASTNLLRPTSDAEAIRKPLTHSAYFPNSGVAHPTANNSHGEKGNNKSKSKNEGNKASVGATRQTSNTSLNGFAAVHPTTKSSLKFASATYQRPSMQSQETFEYTVGPPPPRPAAGGNGTTMRASDLFELRNNMIRNVKKSSDKYR